MLKLLNPANTTTDGPGKKIPDYMSFCSSNAKSGRSNKAVGLINEVFTSRVLLYQVLKLIQICK